MSDATSSTVVSRHRRRGPVVGAAAVAAVSLGGAAISVATGLSPDLAAALGPTARLAVPLPMLAAMLALALLTTTRRRAVAASAAALLGTVGVVCIVSGFFDGGYGDGRLAGGHRAYQGLLVLALAASSTVAFARLRQLLGRRA